MLSLKWQCLYHFYYPTFLGSGMLSALESNTIWLLSLPTLTWNVKHDVLVFAPHGHVLAACTDISLLLDVCKSPPSPFHPVWCNLTRRNHAFLIHIIFAYFVAPSTFAVCATFLNLYYWFLTSPVKLSSDWIFIVELHAVLSVWNDRCCGWCGWRSYPHCSCCWWVCHWEQYQFYPTYRQGCYPVYSATYEGSFHSQKIVLNLLLYYHQQEVIK